MVPIASSTAVLRDEEGRPIGGICSFRDLRELHAVPLSQGHAREFQGMLSKNPKMHEIFDLIETVAESDANVLIEGESGTGKELVARAIHRLSVRAGKPFLGVNCASLNENLMESELFGHVRGAFTGAVKDRMGRFEMAEGGTLFLDEVSEIGLHLQAKLLRVVQEREYQRVGRNGRPEGECPDPLRHQQATEGAHRGANVPGRPVLPPERRFRHSAPAPGAEGGHPYPC